MIVMAQIRRAAGSCNWQEKEVEGCFCQKCYQVSPLALGLGHPEPLAELLDQRLEVFVLLNESDDELHDLLELVLVDAGFWIRQPRDDVGHDVVESVALPSELGEEELGQDRDFGLVVDGAEGHVRNLTLDL